LVFGSRGGGEVDFLSEDEFEFKSSKESTLGSFKILIFGVVSSPTGLGFSSFRVFVYSLSSF
jgi:hypothetical protein